MGFLEDFLASRGIDGAESLAEWSAPAMEAVTQIADQPQIPLVDLFTQGAGAAQPVPFELPRMSSEEYAALIGPQSGTESYGMSLAQEPSFLDNIGGYLTKFDDFRQSPAGKAAFMLGGAGLSVFDNLQQRKAMQDALAKRQAFFDARNAQSAAYNAPLDKYTNQRQALTRGYAPGKAFTGNSLKHIVKAADGGSAHYVEGGTAGQADQIPAMLSDGEFVFDAETVSMLGDGNNAAGAAALEQMRQALRKQKRSAPADKIPPKAKKPEQYLKKGKK